MKTLSLGSTSTQAPAVVAGMMRIMPLEPEEIRALVTTATGAGITMFDHADIYGGSYHACEARFGDALRLTASDRAAMILQTKCGIVPFGGSPSFDFSHDHIIEQVDGSLAALRTDYIDVLLLHRPDALVEPDEVARAFDELHAAGKVRHFGVSNHTPGQIDLLRRSVRQPLVANQVQLSLTHASLIAQGVAMNMDAQTQSISRDMGLVDYARANAITLQAWSPYQSGFFTGSFLDNPQYGPLNEVLARLAGDHDTTPMAIATAWITRHPARIQVVTGTTRPDRLLEAAQGADITLSRPEWYDIFRAAGHILP